VHDLSSNGDRLIMEYSMILRCYQRPVKLIGVTTGVKTGVTNMMMSREEIEILMNYQCSWNDICATLNDIESNSGIKEMELPKMNCWNHFMLFFLALCIGYVISGLVDLVISGLVDNRLAQDVEDSVWFLMFVFFVFIIYFMMYAVYKNRVKRQRNTIYNVIKSNIREILIKYKNKYDHLGMRWEIGNSCFCLVLHLDYKFNRLYGMANQIGGFNQPPIQFGNAMNYQMYNQGYNPGMNQGFNPGMNRGLNPGMNRGFNPGMNQGYNPGMNPGYNPGMNQGDNQRVNQGDNQGVNQENENAYQPPQLLIITASSTNERMND